MQKKVAQLLIQNNADLSLKDKLERTPFSLCLQMDNAPLLEFLKDKVSLNKDPELLFAFKDKIFNVEYQHILESLIKNDAPTKETLNCLDANGLTPFLAYIKAFTTNHDGLLVTIQNKVNQQSFIHGDNRRMYQLTNADLFDKLADQTNYYNYNQSLTNEEKTQIAKEFFDQIVVKPFLNILKHLIEKGADVHAQVQKLKKYRDLEEQKRIELQQLAEGEQVPVTAAKKKEEEKVLRREEKLDEIKKRRAGYGGRVKMARKAPYYLRNQQFGLPAQEDEPANKADVFDKINGEKVLREYGSDGLRNAFHLIISQPQKSLFDFIITLGINGDLPDYDEVTPFNLMSN
jgi:hypothetical protein